MNSKTIVASIIEYKTRLIQYGAKVVNLFSVQLSNFFKRIDTDIKPLVDPDGSIRVDKSRRIKIILVLSTVTFACLTAAATSMKKPEVLQQAVANVVSSGSSIAESAQYVLMGLNIELEVKGSEKEGVIELSGFSSDSDLLSKAIATIYSDVPRVTEVLDKVSTPQKIRETISKSMKASQSDFAGGVTLLFDEDSVTATGSLSAVDLAEWNDTILPEILRSHSIDVLSRVSMSEEGSPMTFFISKIGSGDKTSIKLSNGESINLNDLPLSEWNIDNIGETTVTFESYDNETHRVVVCSESAYCTIGTDG